MASEGDYPQAITWLEKLSGQYSSIAATRAEEIKVRTVERNITKEESPKIYC